MSKSKKYNNTPDPKELIEWVKKEISKESGIDWLGISERSKLIYKAEAKSTVLGFSKGFVNLVRVSSWYSIDEYVKELSQIYPSANFISSSKQFQVVRMAKENIFSRENIDEKLTFLLSDKNTIESVLNRYSIPYISFGLKYGGLGKNNFTLTRSGHETIKWIKGQGISFKRENILDQLLIEE